MTRFVLAQLWARRARTGALAVAILAAAGSFTLLSAAARTSTLEVRGTLESNYRTAYDVLVRPTGSRTKLEGREGLVRPNFQSGVFGGITLKQWETIKRIPGVEVAAPIANVGYVLPSTNFPVPLNHHLTDDPVQLFRVSGTWHAQQGTSRIPERETSYVYYTRNEFAPDGERIGELVPGRAKPLHVCGLNSALRPGLGPFAKRVWMSCFSERSPELDMGSYWARDMGSPPDMVGTARSAFFPIFLAAIDPVEEARLLGLDEAVVSGRYLRAGDRAFLRGESAFRNRYVPIIASTRSYLDEEVELTVERLQIPASESERLPFVLASPGARSFLKGLEGQTVETRRYVVDALYEHLLEGTSFGQTGRVSSFSYWSTSGARYRIAGPERLAPATTRNGIAVWESPFYSGGASGLGWVPAPPVNADLQFRHLKPHPVGNTLGPGNILRGTALQVVGRYDPERLPGFSSLTQVPLETYYPPALEPADEASSQALGGKSLLPSQNLGDYIQQPPLFLTTLQGMKPFLNPRFYKGAAGEKAPISTIRIRVAGVSGPDELSQARVQTVAELIHERTGLVVDITAGSSPKPILIELPAGKFGRPELLLQEGWSKKGAATIFTQALDRKSAALLALILLTSGIFLANGALASVRARRAEIGVLLAVGWSRGAVFRAVLSELLLVGLVAGLVAIALAAGVAWALSLDLSLLQTTLALPVALALALAAGLLPAWKASRGRPLEAVRDPVRIRVRARRVRHLASFALVNLARVPTRTLVGMAGLVAGVASLTILLAIQQAFNGVLVDTVLGQAISIQVRPADIVAVILVIALAGLSVADVLYVNVRERAPELVTLRTLGWKESQLGRTIALEGFLIGLLGSLAGAALGLGVGAGLLGVPVSTLAVTAALVSLGGIAVAGIASLLPLQSLRTMTPSEAFAEE